MRASAKLTDAETNKQKQIQLIVHRLRTRGQLETRTRKEFASVVLERLLPATHQTEPPLQEVDCLKALTELTAKTTLFTEIAVQRRRLIDASLRGLELHRRRQVPVSKDLAFIV